MSAELHDALAELARAYDARRPGAMHLMTARLAAAIEAVIAASK